MKNNYFPPLIQQVQIDTLMVSYLGVAANSNGEAQTVTGQKGA